jgi:peptide/nickel transport system ATP-binding protein
VTPLLDVHDLTVRFGPVTAVDGLSFSVGRGETLAIVGESGCGKSVTALSLLRLLPTARVTGRVLLDDTDLALLSPRQMIGIRGRRAAIIFQDPLSALNPVMTIGEQITEVLTRHRGLRRSAARRRAIELLALVRIPEPQRRVDEYPHRFSGGMRQRAMIAAALAGEPSLLIADEPTTALDATVQAQILELLASVQQAFGMALILISHDLGVVAQAADRVVVMYAGRKMEEQAVRPFFRTPSHPYTRSLIRARPRSGSGSDAPLPEIDGIVPSLEALPPGCVFAPRCPHAIATCEAERPALRRVETGALVSCIRSEDLAA